MRKTEQLTEAEDSLRTFLNSYQKEKVLTDDEIKMVNRTTGLLLNEVKRLNSEVLYKGELFLKSSEGSRSQKIDRDAINADMAYQAYTLFYEGRIAPADIDMKTIMTEGGKFSQERPPNGVSWSSGDLIEISSRNWSFGEKKRL